METKAVSITFDNLLAEHVAAARLYYKSTRWAKGDRIAAFALAVGSLLLCLTTGLRWWTPIPFLFAILEWFNLLEPRPLIVRYWIRRNPKFLETYHLTFDDAGIHFRTSSIDARVAWDHYTNVLENDLLWLLVYGSHMYSVIPKRAFQNADEAARFESLVTEHIAAEKEQST